MEVSKLFSDLSFLFFFYSFYIYYPYELYTSTYVVANSTREIITYKNVDLLRRFITDQGKILPRRLTGVTAKEQRQLAKSIKQARILGFLQFLYKE